MSDRDTSHDLNEHTEQANPSPAVTYAATLDPRPHVRPRVSLVSENVTRVLGHTPEAITASATAWPELIHPDDRDEWRDALAGLAQDGSVLLEYRARDAHGTYRWLQDTARVVKSHKGGAAEIAGCWLDMTEHKPAAQRLLSVLAAVDQVSEAVLITDTQSDPPGPRIIYANDAFVEVSGYSREELIGNTPRIMQGPRSDRATLDRVRHALEHEEPFHGEIYNHHKDGTPFLIEWRLSPVRNASGRVVNWIAVQRDITQERAREQVERLHREDLAHAARLSTVGEIATGLAHELNQPLAAINNYAQGCLRRAERQAIEAEQLVETLTLMSEQATRASGIIRRLRSFLRKRETTREAIPPGDIVSDALHLIDPNVRQAQTRIETAIEPGLPPINVDAIQIEQVIVNLVGNALDAVSGLPVSERRVLVRAHRCAQWVAIDVADGGPGVPPEDREVIFDPFYSTSESGMGMGLTISRSITEAHDGRLRVLTDESGQTVFRLQLQAVAAEVNQINRSK